MVLSKYSISITYYSSRERTFPSNVGSLACKALEIPIPRPDLTGMGTGTMAFGTREINFPTRNAGSWSIQIPPPLHSCGPAVPFELGPCTRRDAPGLKGQEATTVQVHGAMLEPMLEPY